MYAGLSMRSLACTHHDAAHVLHNYRRLRQASGMQCFTRQPCKQGLGREALQQRAAGICRSVAVKPQDKKLTSSWETLSKLAPSSAQTSRPHLDASTKLENSEILNELYSSVEEVFLSKGGYVISPKEQRLIEATGGSPTYGELMPAGTDALIEQLLPTCMPGSVFVDLGSGIGRVVLQVAMSSGKAFDRVLGIELSESRHEQAETALQAARVALGLEPAMADALARVDFLPEDVLQSPALLEATHVFMCSTAFGSVACKGIVDRLAASKRFQVLVTSRELPFQPHLRKLGEFTFETSWNRTCGAHVYVRRELSQVDPAVLRAFLVRDGLAWLPSDLPHVPLNIQEPVEGWRFTRSQLRLLPTGEGGVALG